MKVFETETLIIGAGPAGLACAMDLFDADKDFIVAERDLIPGGLSKTYSFTESDGSVFYTDNGPHRFFSKNPRLYDFIGGILGDDWIEVRRQTRQYIGGKYYSYPIDALQALRNVGIVEAFRMLVSYAWAKIKYGLMRRSVSNFEQYVEAHFGKRLGRFCMINYTEKIWGMPASTIHTDWASQRIAGLNVSKLALSLARRVLGVGSGKGVASLVDSFYYPRNGSGQVYGAIVEKLRERGRDVLLGWEAVRINKKRKGFEVSLVNGGGEILVRCLNVVQSMPVKQAITCLNPRPPRRVLDAVSRLSYRSQAYLFVTINKVSLTADQWIYFPEKSVPFGRVSEMRNFSATMSPKGKTSLFIEFFCTEGDKVWNSSAEELLALSVPYFEEMGLFSASDVVSVYGMRQRDVYPVYGLDYEPDASLVRGYLDSVDGLFAIGRPGRFRYNNQDHSLEMGMLAARSIVEGVRHNFDSVGSEKSYYEKGFHRR